jgi:hypothetical protein
MKKSNLDFRHDLSNDFVRALAEDWKEHGAATIADVREKTPDRYCELVAKVVPKEMLIGSDRSSGDYTACETMADIGRALLRQVGLPAAAITSHMADQAAEANAVLIDRLEVIARGH